MLREMIAVDTSLVGLGYQIEPLSILLVSWNISSPLDMVEDSEFHCDISLSIHFGTASRRNELAQAVPD